MSPNERVVMGVWLAGVFAVVLHGIRRSWRRDQVTKGTALPNVTGWEKFIYRLSYFRLVRFYDRDGVMHIFRSGVADKFRKLNDNEAVDVWFDPENPKNAEIEMPRVVRAMVVVVCAFMLVVISFFVRAILAPG